MTIDYLERYAVKPIWNDTHVNGINHYDDSRNRTYYLAGMIYLCTRANPSGSWEIRELILTHSGNTWIDSTR